MPSLLLLPGDRDGAVQGLGCLSPSIPPSPRTGDGLSVTWWLQCDSRLCHQGHHHFLVAGTWMAVCQVGPAPHVHLPHRAIPTPPRLGRGICHRNGPFAPQQTPLLPMSSWPVGPFQHYPDTAVRCPMGTALVHTSSPLCTSCCAQGCASQTYSMASRVPKSITQNSLCRAKSRTSSEPCGNQAGSHLQHPTDKSPQVQPWHPWTHLPTAPRSL